VSSLRPLPTSSRHALGGQRPPDRGAGLHPGRRAI